MKGTFTLSIPQLPHEKWEKLKPAALGGYCSSCKKEVIGFTSWDEGRIQSFFKKRNEHARDRHYPEQLRRSVVQGTTLKTFPYAPLVSFTLLFSTQQAGAQKVNPTAKLHESNDGIARNAMQVQGIVKFAANQIPLPGVHVAIKGATQGAVTGEDGKFSLLMTDPKPADTLLFSFVGMQLSIHKIYESIELAVFMKNDFTMHGETIMLGERSLKRYDLRNLLWRIKNMLSRKY